MLNNVSKSLVASIVALSATSTLAYADVKVVATIKPIHSIVASVMKGVGEPELIVTGSTSPHNISLKPSQASMIEAADLIVWVGPQIETPLESALESLAPKAHKLTLATLSGVELLPLRGDHDHGHGDHGDDHSEEAHSDHDDDHKHEEAHSDHDHDHDKKEEAHSDHDHDHKHEEAHSDHDHDHKHEEAAHDHDDDHKHEEAHGNDDHGHGHAEGDGHIWLDPDYAVLMANAIAEELSEIDPDNAATYAANSAAFSEEMQALSSEIKKQLKHADHSNYIVFHDAYQYFEKQFGLKTPHFVTFSPELGTSAKRISELQEWAKANDPECIFSEPQFDGKIVNQLVDDLSIKALQIDPLASSLTAGPSLYSEFIQNVSVSFSECLTHSH